MKTISAIFYEKHEWQKHYNFPYNIEKGFILILFDEKQIKQTNAPPLLLTLRFPNYQ
jgi:hypothetical protein